MGSVLINMLKTLQRPYQLDSKKTAYSYKSDHRNGKFGLHGAEKLFEYAFRNKTHDRNFTQSLNHRKSQELRKKEKYLTLELRIKIKNLDREMRNLKRYDEKLQSQIGVESKQIQALRRRTENQCRQISERHTKSDTAFLRKQTIHAQNAYMTTGGRNDLSKREIKSAIDLTEMNKARLQANLAKTSSNFYLKNHFD